jgi:ankyrin repeat protein
MSDKSLPARPNLEQYKKQAKELLRDWRSGDAAALVRVEQHAARKDAASLTSAQLVIAREHGFPSWLKFATEIERMRVARVVEEMSDPVAAFLTAATVPTDGSWHQDGTLEEADAILAREPKTAITNIYTAAALGDEAAVRQFLATDASLASAKGGVHGWDALTYLCFSRYLRIDTARSEAFVRTARALLEAGADANTGWFQHYVYDIGPKDEFEAVMYGASALARNAELTKLLLEFGADVNDGETAYHASEGYDNTVLEILLKSGKFSKTALTTVLIRKADWHDDEGLKLALSYGADPNSMEHWGISGMHHSVKRDNGLVMIAMLLDHGGDVTIENKFGFTAAMLAAWRGREDVLRLLNERDIDAKLEGLDLLIAACALADDAAIWSLTEMDPGLVSDIDYEGGTLLAQFAGNGNVAGMERLMEVGVPVDALYEGDGYFEIAKDSTALHVAAWRGRPEAVKLLIKRGAPVNALNDAGQTALQLAVKACVSSYWRRRRTPEWIEPLLKAGASTEGIEIPCGYAEADELLARDYGKREL